MPFATFDTRHGPISININHIIYFRPKHRYPEITQIEITNPTPDEIGYVEVLHTMQDVAQKLDSVTDTHHTT